jgi:hypothetical protein
MGMAFGAYGEKRNYYRVLVGNLEGRRWVGQTMRGYEE